MKPSVVVSALSFKGGVGKSVLVSCIALAVKRATALRPVVVDLVEDATASRLLAPSCYVRGGSLTYATGTDSLEICTVEDGAKADVIPPGRAGGEIKPERIRHVVEALKGEYNLILLDLPGTSETHSLAVKTAIDISDAYIFVLTPQIIHLLDRFRQLIGRGKPYAVVLNRYFEGAPGKHEVLGLGASPRGQAGFIVYDEPEVEIATIRGQLPCEIKGVKFQEAVDRIAQFVVRTFFQ